MAGKHEGLKNEINRGSTEKRQDAILMTSSQRQKCLSDGPDCCQFYYLILNIVKRCWILETAKKDHLHGLWIQPFREIKITIIKLSRARCVKNLEL